METARIAALLAPYLDGASLTPAQLEQISTYIDLLIRWNSRVNLTAIRTSDEIVTRHFGESFFAARHLFPWGAECGADTPVRHLPSPPARPVLLDLGSGAGFPGLPIKIWSPNTPITLIESNNKKVAFLREAIRAIGLTDINVSAARAEDLRDSLASTVTLRAVERFNQVLHTAIRLLAPSGRLALLISDAQLNVAEGLAPALSWSNPKSIPNSKSRIFTVAIRS